MSEQEETFITITANGMRPGSHSSFSDIGEDSTITTPSPRTHDTSRSAFHVKHISQFATELEQAAGGVFPNRDRKQLRYSDVEVILIRWNDDNRFGVSCELEDLCKVFNQGYGFKTTIWLIPTEDPLQEVMGKVLSLVKEAEKDGRLLIVYYAGHAAMDEARQQVWFRTNRRDEGSLEWFAIQPLFLKVKADVLFLLDCCSAASAASAVSISHNVTGTKETIAACGFEAQAPEPGAHSFTCELIEVLDKWKCRAPFSVAMLHSELLANLRHPKPKKDKYGKMVESRRTPVYFVTTSNAKIVSIELACRHPEIANWNEDSRPRKRQRVSPEPSAINEEQSKHPKSFNPTQTDCDSSSTRANPEQLEIDKYAEDQLKRLLPDGDLAIPHVLISLALEGEQLLEIGAWNKWLRDVPAFAKYARVEGLYKSHSTLLILSIPVVIWDLLPEDLACSFIGYVDSANHVREGTWQDNQDLESWLSNKEGWGNSEGTSSRDIYLDMPKEDSSDPHLASQHGSNAGKSSSSSPKTHIPQMELDPKRIAAALHCENLSVRLRMAKNVNIHTSHAATGYDPVSLCGVLTPKLGDAVSVSRITSPTSIAKEPQKTPQSMLSEKKSQTSRPDPRHATFIKDSLDLSHESSSFQKSPSDDDPSSLSHISTIAKRTSEKSSKFWRRAGNLVSPRRPGESHRITSSTNSGAGLGPIKQIYSRLDLSRNDIRLVVIHPGRVGEVIRADLVDASLSNSPQYEALSYAWGSPDLSSEILLNNQKFRITPNLADALGMLRTEYTVRTMWIDAICINQADLEERNTQVAKMREIFERAAHVIVWLGPETGSTRKAFEYLNQNAGKYLQSTGLQITSELPDSIWKYLTLDVFARPWWTRIWVMQEIALPAKITVLCGSSTIGWDLLMASTMHYRTSLAKLLYVPRDNLEESQAILRLAESELIRNFIRNSGSLSLKHLLMCFRTRQTSDPRDRIYAILGLIDRYSSKTDELLPDYRKPVSEVYANVVRYYIKHHGQLDTILLKTSRDDSLSHLPSWVPDWGQPLTVESFEDLQMSLRDELPNRVYCAAGDSPMSASFSDQPTELLVRGFAFHQIRHVVVPLHLRAGEKEFLDFITAVERTVALHCGAAFYRNGTEEMYLAVARTLSGDLDWTRRRCHQGRTLWDICQNNYVVSPKDYIPDISEDQQSEMLRMEMVALVIRTYQGRSFMILDEGYIGISPDSAQPGDLVCIVFGCDLPVVLRREGERYIYVGRCYVHGIMDGEAIKDYEHGKFKSQVFTLV